MTSREELVDFIYERGESMYEIKKYVSDLTNPLYANTALGTDFYQCVYTKYTDTVFKLFPLQHMYGSIDLLKTNMSDREFEILRNFDIRKRPCWYVEERFHTIPYLFECWPDNFELVTEKDDEYVVDQKKRCLRRCLNRKIYFMRRYIYESGVSNELYIARHLNFILVLQILAAKLES